MSYPWLKATPEQLLVQVRVKPDARQNAIALDVKEGLQISLKASPQGGKANKMLIQYLSKLLRIPQKQLTIVRGAASRTKVLAIKITPAEQEKAVNLLIGLSN
ncbi:MULTISPECIES: DUF167 domain-containing protein [unclassified Legionella]|uniref:DUF167 domain-containing protein n=1 Tax=unclassified Legionella TaxID=2622702 RepID=UPI0010561A05|nr:MULTISPECIES: DUF167 domain-containing protein [unclassified Legionella]MDI9819209.1 DUF167 domain-containing protein [Legionella sp. PL877]